MRGENMLKPPGRTTSTNIRRGGDITRKSGDQGYPSPGRPGPRPALRAEKEEAGNPADSPTADSLIADMAKGFVAAQAQMACPPSGNTEMLRLLEKISSQLDTLQPPGPAGPQQDPQTQSQTAGQMNKQTGQQPDGSAGSPSSAEIQNLFSKLMASGKAASPGSDTSNQSSGGGAAAKAVPAQTAAQALAQAQFELSKELEASLGKLKQVISESEELANRIGNLIGQENKSQ